MTTPKQLEKRLNKITNQGKACWIPPWVAVLPEEEIAAWKAIQHAYTGPDRSDRQSQFEREMREKYPTTMPLTFSEQMARGVKALKENEALRRSEGITKEMESEEAGRKFIAFPGRRRF